MRAHMFHLAIVGRMPGAVLALMLVVAVLVGLSRPVPAWAGDGSKQARGGLHSPAGYSTNEPPPIQDNSFLIEEAYNQEFGVVQHINTFTRSWNTHAWVYTFTQEWPVPGQTHQLSYTLSVLDTGVRQRSRGIGDMTINYRYQLVGSGETRIAIAPRISLLLPIGDSHLGRGFGGAGVQTNIPLSWSINTHLVTHWNVGATIIPSSRNESGACATTTGYNLGQSFVWLVRPRFNVLFETLWTGSESVVSAGRTKRSHDLLLSPGIRWAHNFANGLQIVPGIGIPIGVGPSTGERGFFLYLSFEHPFRTLRRQ